MERDLSTSYQRNLPHWRSEGALYFVTFRTADSLPEQAVRAMREEARKFHAQPDPTVEEQEYFQRHQAGRLFQALDQCHGECPFKIPSTSAIVADALRFHHGSKLLCGDFVVMPNHVHWLVAPIQGRALEEMLQSVKRWTARQVNELIGKSGSFWQKESFDRIVRSADELARTRAYIENNGRKAGLRLEEFHYSRCDWL